MADHSAEPVISVVVPVFNMARFVGACLDSILDQEGARVQAIVVDGGSSDGTREIVERYAARLHHWVSEPDRGQSNAINKGFDRATGDVLAWLNADEEYLPGTLAAVSTAFRSAPDVDFVYGDRLDCDAGGRTLGTRRYPRMHPRLYALYHGHVLPTDASFWSARVHALTGRLDEEHFQHLVMDYDWLLRLSMHVRGYRCLGRPLSRFKQHDTRKTPAARGEEIARLWRFARERVIHEHRIPRARLLCGWVAAGLLARWRLGRFDVPRPSTLRKMVGRPG